MDDLDRLALDVAVSILEAEAEVPGSQAPASVRLAEQILRELLETETRRIDHSVARGSLSS